LYHGIGNCYYNLKNYEGAIAWYTKLRELDPKYVYGPYNMGRCMRALKRYDEAIQWYKQASAIDPTFWSAYNEMGKLTLSVLFLSNHRN